MTEAASNSHMAIHVKGLNFFFGRGELRKQVLYDINTILMVTHNNRILDVADCIINLVDGRLESDDGLSHFVATHEPLSLDRRMFIM